MDIISVVGAGTMGNGIAHVFAQNGFSVFLTDVSENNLIKAVEIIGKNLDRQVKKGELSEDGKKAALSKITTSTDIKASVKNSRLVIEAVTENPKVKLQIFKDLDEYTPPSCILASNTSSISISRIASVTKRPDKVIGMHFMNPVPVMKLIEVIKGKDTSSGTADEIIRITHKIGKTPVVVRDSPGFIANRLLIPMINEAISSLEEGVAGVEEIDTIMKLGMAHPMGPLQLADLIGLDVCLYIMNVLYEGFQNPKYLPAPLLVKMVEAGEKGLKSGQGFYKYTPGSKDLVVADRFR